MTPSPAEASEVPNHPSFGKSSKFRLRTIGKWLFVVIGCLFVLILCLFLLLTYWFPANIVRHQLEAHLSELLDGTINIQALSFNALTGLQLEEVQFLKPGQPPLTLEHLVLDYDLLGLLVGDLTINEIRIDGADLMLNLPELSESAPPGEPADSGPDRPLILSTLPISVNLNTVSITDSHLHIIISTDVHVKASNLNFESSGTVSSEHANVEGGLRVDHLDITVHDKHLHLPVEVGFDAELHLPTQRLTLQQLTVFSDPAGGATLSGTVSEFFTQDRIDLALTDTRFHLGAIMKLAQDFVPREWSSATLDGTLTPTLTVQGTFADNQFNGTAKGTIQATNFQARLPSQRLELGSTSFTIQAQDLQMSHNELTNGMASATFASEHVTFQKHTVQSLDVDLSSTYLASGPVTANLSASGIMPPHEGPLQSPARLPFDITVNAQHHLETLQSKISNLAIRIRNVGDLKGTVTLQPQSPPSQDMDATLELRIKPQTDALLPLLPFDFLEGIAIQKNPEPDTLVVQATGTLHEDFRPKQAAATAALNLTPFTATSDETGITGALEQATILLSSKYQERDGRIQGTLGLSGQFSDLLLPETISLGSMHFRLKSSFQGQVSSTFQPLQFQSHDQLQAVFQRISLTNASVTTSLPYLKISLDTQEDLLAQNYVMKQFTAQSQDILDLNMRGRYTEATRRFAIDLQVPLLHIGNMLPNLSGPFMEGMQVLNPNGRIEMSVQAAGQIPQTQDLDELTFPFGLKSSIRVHHLEGAVAGYKVQEGNGTFALGYSPEASPQTQLTTNLRSKQITLPKTFSIHTIVNPTLQLKMSAPDLNEALLDTLHLHVQGLDLSANGQLVGLRPLLASTASQTNPLAKLFMQLETSLKLDIERFQPVLQSYGFTGTGTTQVNMSVQKQEESDLNAALEIASHALSVVQDGTELTNMNGGLQIRKTLHWSPNGAPGRSPQPFSPSARIAELKKFSEKGRRISIEYVKVGPLTIQHLSKNVAFQQQTLRFQNLAMNLLGGGIGGNFAITADHPLRLSGGFEFTNLDINQLLTQHNQIARDSEITGTVALDAILKDQTGAIDLSRLAFRVNITHIGKEALDRLLIAIDPEGSNPTISNARAQLKLANPSQVDLEIGRGQLEMTIAFRGALLPTLELHRVPIGKMKHIEKLTAAIPNWEDLMPLVNMIGAVTYGLGPDGELILR